MRFPFSSLLSGRIGTQITVVVIAALLLTHLVMTAAFFLLNPRPEHWDGPLGSAQRLVFLVKILNAEKNTETRETLLAAALAVDPELMVLPSALRAAEPQPHGPLLRDLKHQLGEGQSLFVADQPSERSRRGRRLVVAALFDGRELAAPFPQRPPPGLISPMAVITLVFLASAVTVLSWWAARQITAPLTRFADAAERFTTEAANVPLVESGPLEVRRATKALNDMQARVLKLVAERTRMLAAVSHDLRTPITRLRLRAEQIEKDELRMSILRDLATMQRLTHSALAFLRGQSEPCVLAKTDLPSLVQTACDGFADIGREVTYSGPPHLYVTCEPEQLLRAVENLVDNSLKFGNSVAVTVRQQGHVAAIEVRDDGPGIVNAEKVVVFEPFYRGDTARNLNNGESFGLGLSIAQNIVQRSGGRLELVDAAPTGLLARVLLPLAGDDGF